MLETETAAPAGTVTEEAPPASFGDEVAAAAPETETPAAPPEEVKETWDVLHERIQADEALKPEYDAHLEQVRKESRSEGRKEVQERMQRAYANYNAAAQAAASGVGEIWKVIQKAAKDGMVDTETVVEALQAQPDAWKAINGLSHIAGTFDGAKRFIGLLAGEEKKLAAEFAGRVDAVAQQLETAESLVADFREALVADAEKKAEERGYKRGLKEGRSSEAEALKATERKSAGPGATGGKGAAGGRPTLAEYAAATSEQRAEWRAKGIEPLAS